jgi:hypothetical protein
MIRQQTKRIRRHGCGTHSSLWTSSVKGPSKAISNRGKEKAYRRQISTERFNSKATNPAIPLTISSAGLSRSRANRSCCSPGRRSESNPRRGTRLRFAGRGLGHRPMDRLISGLRPSPRPRECNARSQFACMRLHKTHCRVELNPLIKYLPSLLLADKSERLWYALGGTWMRWSQWHGAGCRGGANGNVRPPNGPKRSS